MERRHHYLFLSGLQTYFARRTSAEVRELFMNTAILDLAAGMILIFEPIYLYQQGVSIFRIMLFYLEAYVIYFFLLPLGAKFANIKGYEHSLLLASPFWVLYYISLFLVGYYAPIFLFIAPVFLALQKMFYWPGYHADFAQYAITEETGREVSNGLVIATMGQIVAPFLGGALIKFFGYPVVFILASLLIAISNIPTMLTPEKFVPKDFSYFKAYRRLFKPINRRALLGYLGYGEELILLTLWPIYIFLVLKSAFSVGVLAAVSAGLTILTVLSVGRLADKKNKMSLLRLTSVFYMFSWLLRTLRSGAAGLYLFHIFGSICKNSVSVEITSLVYNRAKNYSVMKGIVLFEMILVIGKILAIVVVLVLLAFVGQGSIFWFYSFLFAGVASLLYRFL